MVLIPRNTQPRNSVRVRNNTINFLPLPAAALRTASAMVSELPISTRVLHIPRVTLSFELAAANESRSEQTNFSPAPRCPPATRQPHGQRAADQHQGIAHPQGDVEFRARGRERIRVDLAISQIGHEHADEEHDFGQQENPHPERGRFLLLFLVFEMVAKYCRVTSQLRLPPEHDTRTPRRSRRALLQSSRSAAATVPATRGP